jgi:hypothetical protein
VLLAANPLEDIRNGAALDQIPMQVESAAKRQN